MRRNIMALALALGTLTMVSAAAQPAWHTSVGYIQLVNEFGVVADGTGLTVALVEAPTGGGNFMPDTSLAEFSGTTFTQGSPGPTTPSGHATGVAANFFGNFNSITPQIPNVTCFEANDWLGVQLGFNAGVDPTPQPFAVSNHSYIGSGLSVADATNLLQRLDYAINQSGMTAVVGVANSGALPQLLAPAYNTISVGRSDGLHSAGVTTFYGSGRTKPEIVVPSTSTSEGTARVSSIAAFLYDAGMGTNATQPEVLKAILLAGATKNEFTAWDRTTTRPLDEVFGAGEANVYNSYRILAGGEFGGSTGEPVAAAPNEAWDYGSAAGLAAPIYYDLVVDVAAKDLSVILDWNIDVIDQDAGTDFIPLTELANMDLRLYDSTSGFLNTLLDSSLSTVDNVEHIFQAFLGPGRYTLEVRSDVAHDYGLAWRFTSVPEPNFGWIGAGAFALFAPLIRRRQNRSKA
jgi:hypothetical protein